MFHYTRLMIEMAADTKCLLQLLYVLVFLEKDLFMFGIVRNCCSFFYVIYEVVYFNLYLGCFKISKTLFGETSLIL